MPKTHSRKEKRALLSSIGDVLQRIFGLIFLEDTWITIKSLILFLSTSAREDVALHSLVPRAPCFLEDIVCVAEGLI
jgi:hypothetical protein